MNSLGRLKFDFDNNFSVYMHGTPHQELFAKAERNLSSGCIRLEEPEVFAKIVLAPNEGDWSAERIRAEVDKATTRWIGLTDPLPILVTYDTVFTDESGLNFRTDAYDYDRLLTKTLHANEN